MIKYNEIVECKRRIEEILQELIEIERKLEEYAKQLERNEGKRTGRKNS